jgi:hypothetical protein
MEDELGLRMAIPVYGTENELLGSNQYRTHGNNCQENPAESAKSRGHFVRFWVQMTLIEQSMCKMCMLLRTTERHLPGPPPGWLVESNGLTFTAWQRTDQPASAYDPPSGVTGFAISETSTPDCGASVAAGIAGSGDGCLVLAEATSADLYQPARGPDLDRSWTGGACEHPTSLDRAARDVEW